MGQAFAIQEQLERRIEAAKQTDLHDICSRTLSQIYRQKRHCLRIIRDLVIWNPCVRPYLQNFTNNFTI